MRLANKSNDKKLDLDVTYEFDTIADEWRQIKKRKYERIKYRLIKDSLFLDKQYHEEHEYIRIK
jgi:hypothetical protein